MNDTDNSSQAVTSWVFLSHSNEDYDKVAVLRDMLEEQKKRPIMFYLKCMENPAYRKELERLLKREIDAREQFILCDSENARKSEWVQEEVKYIKSKGRKYQTIDIDADPKLIRRAVTDFVNRDKVFISYSRSDYTWAQTVKEVLKQKGFSVFLDREILRLGDDIAKTISGAIDESERQGYQICLLSRAYCQSSYCLSELEYILNHTSSGGDWLLLVVIEDIPFYELPASIRSRNYHVCSTNEDFEFRIEMIVNQFLEMDRSHNQ